MYFIISVRYKRNFIVRINICYVPSLPEIIALERQDTIFAHRLSSCFLTFQTLTFAGNLPRGWAKNKAMVTVEIKFLHVTT